MRNEYAHFARTVGCARKRERERERERENCRNMQISALRYELQNTMNDTPLLFCIIILYLFDRMFVTIIKLAIYLLFLRFDDIN